MRVLLLSDFYPPVVGGVEQHVQVLGRELARRGHAVHVATIHPGRDLPDEADDAGVTVHRLRSTLARIPGLHAERERPFAAPAPDLELSARLLALGARLRPTVVHAHSWAAASWLPVAPLVPAAFVLTAHEYGLVCPRKDLVFRGQRTCDGPALAKCLRCAGAHYGIARGIPITLGTFASGAVERRLADGLIAVSEAVAIRNRLDRRLCSVIPNFLPDEDPDETAAIEPYLAQLPDIPFVLFVGALGGHKGFPQLAQAWASLPGPRPPLVAIGHRWHDTPARLPPGITVLEDWPNDAVRAAWRRAMAGVIPSTWAEPFGIVALEAMAAGVPVVASRTGGLAEVVRDGETGLLVPPRDVEGLAAALVRLIGDPALRERLGQGARARMAAYRAGAVVPRIEAAYQSAIARSAGLVA